MSRRPLKQLSKLWIEAGVIFGWVFDSLRETLRLDIWVDGARVRGSLSGILVHPAFLEADPPPHSQCGFSLPIPDGALDGRTHDIVIKVADWAATLGLPHTILLWQGEKPSQRIQEAARDARYALLVDHARAIEADALVIAHHADDQAETVLFRLTRGSGIAGLAGMARVSQRRGLPLHRPLLDWRKADLLAFCAGEGLAFLEDPSNADPKFARARLRRLGVHLEQEGLDATALNRIARRAAHLDGRSFSSQGQPASQGQDAGRELHAQHALPIERAVPMQDCL